MAERVEEQLSQDTSAAEQAAEDLNVLFPNQTIPIGGKSILVQEYPFVKWIELKPLCTDFIEQLASMVKQENILFDDLLEFFENNFQIMQKLLGESIEQPFEFLKTLKDEEMDLLLLTWWTVNKHFFLKSVERLLRKTQEKPSDGSISSNA